MAYYDSNLERTDECFVAALDSAKDTYNALKCLYHKQKTAVHCLVNFCSEGLRVCVDTNKNLQGNAYFKRSDFSEFDYRAEEAMTVRIPLLDLLEAINCIGTTAASVRISFKGIGHPLDIVVTDESFSVNVSVSTYKATTLLSFDFDSDAMITRVLMDPKTLRDVIREIEPTNSTVCIKITSLEMEISSQNENVEIMTRIPRNSVEISEIDCSEEISFHYKAMFIKRLQTAMCTCSRVCVRINERGILNIQFMLSHSHGQPLFLDYYCVPDLDESLE